MIQFNHSKYTLIRANTQFPSSLTIERLKNDFKDSLTKQEVLWK